MKKKIKKIIRKSAKIRVGEPEAEKMKKTKIKVVGIGGGGGNIVSELAQRVEKATFFAANSDLKALKEISRKVVRFPFGQSFTQGLGTGLNPELGEMAAQNEKERIKKIFQGQDLVILIASLGGGVGSGALPVFAKISQSLGNLTYGIFTLPFKFEGEKKMEIAKKALEQVKPKLNVITILPNERIFQIIDRTTPLKEALSCINKSLAESLQGLIETIYQPGLINIDFADLRTVFQGRGRLAYLNTVEVQRKEGIIQEIIEKVFNSPLYPYGIQRAKGVLYNIAGEKELNLEEVSQISRTISEKVHKEAKIIFGISYTRHRGRHPKYSNLIKTTLLAIGCGTKIFPGQPKKLRKKRLTIKPPPVAPTPPIKEPILKSKPKPTPKKTKPSQILQHKTQEGKPKKLKIKVQKEPEKKIISRPKVDELRSSSPFPKARVVEEVKKITPFNLVKGKVRKNALQIKKEVENSTSLPKGPSEREYGFSQAGVPEVGPSAEKRRVRKNALQLKKEIEEEERKMLEKEKFWDTPAFLRKREQKN